MAKPVSVTWAFNTLSGNIPLAYLDTNFNNILTQLNDTLTYSNYVADTGSANSYVVAFGGGLTTSYTAGLLLVFRAANNNTGASTLNVNALGARSIVNGNGAALSANQIVANSLVLVCYDGTVFRLLNDPSGGTVTAGNLAVTGNLTVGGTSIFTGLVTANGGISGAFNGTVGASTPSTGAFTTLSATGNVSTANGLVFSSISSTPAGVFIHRPATDAIGFGHGGAEQMRLASGNLGIGTASPGQKLDVIGSGRSTGAWAVGDSSGNFSGSISNESDASKSVTFAADPGNAGANSFMRFNVDGSERARIDASGNLGIGINNPAAARLIAAYNNPVSVPAAGASGHGFAVGTVGYGIAAGALTSGNSYLQVTRWDGTATNYDLLLQPNGGNVGIGTTPSAWRSGARALQLGINGYVSLFEQGNGAANLTFAAYESATNTFAYRTTGDAPTLYSQVGGVHTWSNAVAGTAGNTFSFTERMRLDSSGNLGIGTTSPIGKVSVLNTGTGQVGFNAGAPSSPVRGNLWYDTDGTGWKFQIGKWQSSAFTAQMTFQDDGNVGIGTASPSYRLDASTSSTSVARFTGPANCLVDVTDGTGTLRMQMLSNEPFITSLGSFAMRFGTNNTERMRLDSSGNLGIGTASPSSYGKLATVAATTATALYAGTGTQGLFVSVDSATRFVTYASSGSLSGAHRWLVGNTEMMQLDLSGNLGIGTASPLNRLVVSNGSSENFEFNPGSVALNGGAIEYINRATATTRPDFNFYIGTNGSHKFYTNALERMRITGAGNIVAGASAALATTATDGFLYVPTCAGTPTGTPTSITGMAPIVINTTNNKLYFYSGGAWRDAGP